MHLEVLPGGGVRCLAPAKVNLYLEVLGLRPDGYHEIDTILQEVSLHDVIEFRPSARKGIRLELLWPEGQPGPLAESEDNLVVRAARLLGRRAHGAPLEERGLDIRLEKRIPIGGGLGGGSSDAAAALLAVSKLWGLSLSRDELSGLGAELGSDVPFFLWGGTARCRGRGERITPLGEPGGGEPLHYVLAYPGIPVSTSLIYNELDRTLGSRSTLTVPTRLDSMSAASIWKALRSGELLYNRLQVAACHAFPEIEECLKEIEKEPFIATLMSGSGSTVYGLSRSREEADRIAARLRRRIRGKVIVAQSEPEPCLPPSD